VNGRMRLNNFVLCGVKICAKTILICTLEERIVGSCLFLFMGKELRNGRRIMVSYWKKVNALINEVSLI
jgi:hypothetical protein